MQSVILSTDGVPEAERFAYWREAVLERYIGVTGERHKEQPAPFAAQLVGAVGGAVARIRARAEGHHVIRQPRDIARRGGEAQITVFRASKKVAWRRPNGQEWVTQPGDLAVGDTTLPFSCWVEGDYDSETWVLPRKLLDPHLPIALRGPPYPILSGASGVAGIIKAYLDAFAAQIDALDDREADLVADNFCRLLAVACGAQAEDQREPIRLARLEEAKRYINLHLADPSLCPEKAAGALKMSVRRLHLLFEPSGTSFAKYVLRRRLEECRATLANPVADRSVTDIALAWGFRSLATFHRTFREAFGETAGEMRSRTRRR